MLDALGGTSVQVELGGGVGGADGTLCAEHPAVLVLAVGQAPLRQPLQVRQQPGQDPVPSAADVRQHHLRCLHTE